MTPIEQLNTPEAKQKRVLIAQDVIKHIEAEMLIPKGNVWLKSHDMQPIVGRDEDVSPGEVKARLQKKVCEVCMVGGLMYATICRFNNISAGEAFPRIYDRHTLRFQDLQSYMGQFFESQQLRLMEFTFENGYGLYKEHQTEDELIKKARAFNEPFVMQDYEEDDHDIHFGHDRDSDDPEEPPIEPDLKSKLMLAICQNIIENNGTFLP